jgi:hypothetical protein
VHLSKIDRVELVNSNFEKAGLYMGGYHGSVLPLLSGGNVATAHILVQTCSNDRAIIHRAQRCSRCRERKLLE